MAMTERKLGTVTPLRVQDGAHYSRLVAAEVRGLVAQLGALGWTLWDVAASLDCSRRSIVSWRHGAAEMPASKLLRLRDVVALACRRAA